MFVALDAAPVNREVACGLEQGVASPWFPLLDVGDMDFHRREGSRQDGVMNGVRGVRVGARVEHNTRRVPSGLVDPVDDGALVIGLKRLDAESVRSTPSSRTAC